MTAGKLLLFLPLMLLHAGLPETASNKKYFNDGFLDTVQYNTFKYFWECVDPATGLTPDRYPTKTFSSTAAIGFALTSYGIGAERNYVPRNEAAERVLTTLRYLYSLPQGNAMMGTAGYRGFFYHFLNLDTGTRFNEEIELSSIDTALLMAGILFCQSYFTESTTVESGIRAYADSLFLRVDWEWLLARPPLMSMGWYPDKGIHQADWHGYNEAMILYLLALGSPTHPIDERSWKGFTDGYQWLPYQGEEFVSFGPLFGHQYSHVWIDFRGIRDAYMQKKGIDYHENSRRATVTHRKYAISNPNKKIGYSADIWGFTACDGPADVQLVIDGKPLQFQTYAARGVSADWTNDDGTIAPTAAGGSIAFTPEISIAALRAMKEQIPGLWTSYGFLDAFNLTYRTAQFPDGWVDHDYLGIDQGPIIAMIENLRSELVWNTMKKNRYIVDGLRRAGFSGGWLNNARKGK